MTNIIDSIIDRLANVEFLSCVGMQPRFDVGAFQLEAVSSWQDAISIRGSDAASDAFAEGTGRLTRTLSLEFRKEYRKWNEYARRDRELLENELFPKIDERVDNVLELQAIEWWPQFVKDSIRWDVLHFAAEQEYSEFVPPGFYSTMLEIYEAGHFPCHWNEVWPDGRIWLF